MTKRRRGRWFQEPRKRRKARGGRKHSDVVREICDLKHDVNEFRQQYSWFSAILGKFMDSVLQQIGLGWKAAERPKVNTECSLDQDRLAMHISGVSARMTGRTVSFEPAEEDVRTSVQCDSVQKESPCTETGQQFECPETDVEGTLWKKGGLDGFSPLLRSPSVSPLPWLPENLQPTVENPHETVGTTTSFSTLPTHDNSVAASRVTSPGPIIFTARSWPEGRCHFANCRPFKDIRDFPFVYERYPDNFNFPSSLLDVDHHLRWTKARSLYVVMQSKCSVGAAERLDRPHYQMNLRDLGLCISRHFEGNKDSNLQVILLMPGAEIDDEFLYIKSLPDLPPSIPVDSFFKALPPNETNATNCSRQRRYRDVGFCTNQNSARSTGCDLGLARPRMFANSLSNELEAIGGSTISIFETVRRAKLMSGFEINTFRRGEFADKLLGGTPFEAYRLHLTHANSLCSPHSDTKNSKDVHLRHVLWVSFLAPSDGRLCRLGLVGYWRSSVDSYLKRRSVHEPYLRLVLDTLAPLPDFRSLPPHLIASYSKYARIADKEACPLGLIPTQCSLFVEGYLQPAVAVMTTCIRVFKLDFAGTVSLLSAAAKSFHSMAYVCAVGHRLLMYKPDVRNVGYTFLKMLRVAERSFPSTPPLRFRKNHHYQNIEKRHEWDAKIEAITKSLKEGLVQDKLSIADYRRIRRVVERELAGVGELISQHFMAIGALVGVIPFTLFNMCDGGARKAYLLLKETYPNLPEQHQVLQNIHHAIVANRPRAYICPRNSENMLCKAGRLICRSDNRFRDLHHPLFPEFTVVGPNTIQFSGYTSDGYTKEGFVHEGSLFAPDENGNMQLQCLDLPLLPDRLPLVHLCPKKTPLSKEVIAR